MDIFKFGPLIVSMEGSKKLISEVAKDFEPYTSTEPVKADLVIQVLDEARFSGVDYYIGKGRNAFGAGSIFIDKSPYFSYSISGLFDPNAQTVFAVVLKRPSFVRRLIDALKGLVGVEFGDAFKVLRMSISNYSLLWSIVAITLLKKDVAFIHAGAVSNNSVVTLLAGTGGGGKTSATMGFIENYGQSFVSEDFGMLGGDGSVYFSPKSITFYESDLQWGGKISERVKGGFRGFYKFKWSFLVRVLGRNPMAKISPFSLFSMESKQGGIKLSKAVYLRRANAECITLENISADDFAERASWASLREMMPFLEILCRVQANMQGSDLFLSPESIRLRMKSIFFAGLNGVDVRLVSAPLKCQPAEICKAINE